jgi:hypothetical protein
MPPALSLRMGKPRDRPFEALSREELWPKTLSFTPENSTTNRRRHQVNRSRKQSFKRSRA